MPQENVLKFGVAARIRGLLAALALICAGLTWQLFPGWQNEIVFIAGLPLLFLLLCLVAANVAVSSRYEVDAAGATRRGLFGKQQYRREDYLVHEVISDRPGRPSSLLLRFRTGNLYLDGKKLSTPVQQIADFVRREWGAGEADGARMPGEADVRQVCRYEAWHVSVAAFAGIVLLATSIRIPILWVGALLAAMCFRLVWRSLGWIETNEDGVRAFHRFAAPRKIGWDEIERVDYWLSFSQGGVRIRGGGKVIQAYRWIENYPRLSRLLHDRVDAAKFHPKAELPLTVPMNASQRYGAAAAVALVAANAVPFLLNGDYTLYAGFVAVPAVGGLVGLLLYRRKLVVDREEIRDISLIAGIRTVRRYPRSELVDARLGRQMTAGGLWLKFKNVRLEISNRHAWLPPEMVWACLRREWAWEAQPKAENPGETQAGSQNVA